MITPGGVPGVLEEPVVKASGFIMAIADNQNTMVDRVKFLSVKFCRGAAIGCIYDAAFIRMNVNIIGINSGDDRLLLKGGLNMGYSK